MRLYRAEQVNEPKECGGQQNIKAEQKTKVKR
jgi:hypothetical protein